MTFLGGWSEPVKKDDTLSSKINHDVKEYGFFSSSILAAEDVKESIAALRERLPRFCAINRLEEMHKFIEEIFGSELCNSQQGERASLNASEPKSNKRGIGNSADTNTLTCSECGEKFPFESHEHICPTFNKEGKT